MCLKDTILALLIIINFNTVQSMDKKEIREITSHITLLPIDESTDSEGSLTPRIKEVRDKSIQFEQEKQTMSFQAIAADRKRRNTKHCFMCAGSSFICFSLAALSAATIIYLKQLNPLCS